MFLFPIVKEEVKYIFEIGNLSKKKSAKKSISRALSISVPKLRPMSALMVGQAHIFGKWVCFTSRGLLFSTFLNHK